MIDIARKKNETRKYEPKNEFRFNFSPSSAGHPDFVFGYKKGKYKSFGLTHKPKKEHKSTMLRKNPDSSDSSPSFLQHKVKSTQARYMSSPLPGWSLDKEDRFLVRYLTKKYKKRQNKKRR